MRMLACLIAMVALICAAVDGPNEAPKKALDKYQGAWRVEKSGDGPGPRSLCDRASLVKTILFDGDTVLAKAGDLPLLAKLEPGDRWDRMTPLDQNDLVWIRGACKVEDDHLIVRFFQHSFAESVNWRLYVDVTYQHVKN